MAQPVREVIRPVLRWLLAAIYLFAGIAHLKSPGGFIEITPDWVPWPAEVVAFTGLCEIAGAIGLLIPGLRRAAAIGLAAYALCVYPANIKHAVDGIVISGVSLGWWYHAPRLALQPVIFWWALWAGGVINWPFGRGRKAH